MTYSILAAVFFGLTLLFIKASSFRMFPLLANFLFSMLAASLQLIIFLVWIRIRQVDVLLNSKTLLFTLGGGTCLALYSLFTFLSLSQTEIWRASPIIYAGGISLATLLGVTFMGDSLGWTKIFGLALACGSLFFLFAPAR